MLSGLAPIIGKQPRILILGSMPSDASLEKQQYYGHPQNAFWPLLAQLLGFELNQSYAINVKSAKKRHIAIWDVIGQCDRRGSLDSAIVKDSIAFNAIPQLLMKTPSVTAIGLNGGTAAKMFKRHLRPHISASNPLDIHQLPSTSPANAKLSFDDKCAAWSPLFSNLHFSNEKSTQTPSNLSK